jgi:hypothetical protein
MAVSMEFTVYWDVTPSSLVDIYRCIRWIHCFLLQGRRAYSSLHLIPSKWKLDIPRKRQQTSTKLHDVTSQKTVTLIDAVVKIIKILNLNSPDKCSFTFTIQNFIFITPVSEMKYCRRISYPALLNDRFFFKKVIYLCVIFAFGV